MEIKLNTGIVSLEAGNTYIVDTDLDYTNNSIKINGDCILLIKQGGYLKNATLDNTGLHKVNLKIESNDNAIQNVKYIGDFIQANEIIVLYTTLLENYTLPAGFLIKSLFYKEQGDLGGSLFDVIPFSKFSHRLYLYPFNPKNEVSPIIVYSQKDKYFAEELGIFKSNASDNSLAVDNRKQLERHGGRSFLIKFGLGYYHINNVNMDNCTDWKGAMGSYYSMNLEGSTNDYTEDIGRTYIITDRNNFIYSVKRGHFKCSAKYMNIETIAGNHYTEEERAQKRMGYGFTRFNKDPLSNSDAIPNTTAELSVELSNVTFYGFWAGFYSGQWSTDCTLRSVTFSGCRYGFYSESSSNLSLFENIGVHNCAFGLTVGGDKCTIRRVEITPENWYRDEDAIKTEYFYGYCSNSGFQNCYIEDVYLEDYLADTESRKKYIIYKLSAGSNVTFNRIAFQSVANDTSAYHLEIYRQKGYPYENLQTNKTIANFINSTLPTKVRTEEDWVITGIAKDDSYFLSKASYKVGEETKVVQFFSGRGVLHFWKGKPNISWDNIYKIAKLYFTEQQHIYYEALTASNEKKPVLMRQILNGSSFVSPTPDRRLNLEINIKGTCKMRLPFILNVGKMRFEIIPYEVEGNFVYNYSWNGIVYKDDITDSSYFNLSLSTDKINSEFMPITGNNYNKIIDVEDVEFKLYEF